VSTESRIDSEEFRENKGNLDQVQGVHNVKERPSVEEPGQRNTRSAGRIYFQEILRTELSKSQECKECVGNQNIQGDQAQKRYTFQKCRRGPRDRLVGGEKVETFEHLENLLSRKKSEAQEEERQQPLDHSAEDQQRLIKARCTSLSALHMQKSELTKVLKSRSNLGPSIVKEDRWRKIHNSGSSWTRRR
jgi:hypothetical protein